MLSYSGHIERHGEPIGFYIPTGRSRQVSFDEALENLERTVRRVLAETGLSEDELTRLFDLNQPLPEQGPGDLSSPSHAAGR